MEIKQCYEVVSLTIPFNMAVFSLRQHVLSNVMPCHYILFQNMIKLPKLSAELKSSVFRFVVGVNFLRQEAISFYY